MSGLDCRLGRSCGTWTSSFCPACESDGRRALGTLTLDSVNAPIRVIRGALTGVFCPFGEIDLLRSFCGAWTEFLGPDCGFRYIYLLRLSCSAWTEFFSPSCGFRFLCLLRLSCGAWTISFSVFDDLAGGGIGLESISSGIECGFCQLILTGAVCFRGGGTGLESIDSTELVGTRAGCLPLDGFVVKFLRVFAGGLSSFVMVNVVRNE
jgi:hypothetical protein